MYSIILAFRVLEAKIGHPGPIASPAAEDGSGWRRCGTGWHRLRGCNVSGRADFGRPFGNRTGTSGYRHPGGKQAEEFRYAAVLPALPTRADGIRFGSVTAPRSRSRGTSFAVRVALPYPISTTHLGRVCSSGRRSASHPRARKTSDLPPGIGISIAPSILTSAQQ